MAKKHSSKTATEKAMSASEPRLQVFSGWQGVNFAQAPLDWEPNEPIGAHNQRQEDLKPNFFHTQNNLVTVDNLTVETRMDSEVIGVCPEGYEFTGVSCLFHRWLFCVIRKEEGSSFKDRIAWRDINDTNTTQWNIIQLEDAEHNGNEPTGYEIAEIGYFEKVLIATTWHKEDSGTGYEGEIFTASFEYDKVFDTNTDGIKILSDTLVVGRINGMSSVPFVPNIDKNSDSNLPDGWGWTTERYPASGTAISQSSNSTPILRPMGKLANAQAANSEALIEISYAYVNKFGSTIASRTASMNVNIAPQNWNAAQYLKIYRQFPTKSGSNKTFVETFEVTGVDVYATVEGYQTKSFIAHVDVKETDTSWTVNWLGGMQDVSQWTNVQLEEPKENTTKGVKAAHFSNHDSRLYFWGDPEFPYRLYIGGNPGNELSVARGHGGAFVDIEPGTGLEIKGTAKWKTSSGANIITIMCGNPNTNMIKRFNLVETNLTITNEVSSKGYMYEEVSNVVGCNSRWGYGVFADGLYSINRYGLMLTTMAMEYNNQMRIQSISDVIKPIFSERLGHRLDDARMVCIDNIIYILLSEEREHPDEPTILDQVVLCYDLGLKAWYTLTSDEILGSGELILHAFPVDSQEHVEGLGLITKDTVTLYPNTGIQDPVAPDFNILIETGELMGKQPKQMTLYLCQLEFRFDYFIGHATVEIEGIDYYGRPVTVIKELNSRKIGNQPDTPASVSDNLMRDYTEWIRVDKLMESYRIRIKGRARFRLNSINAKVYIQNDMIGLPYGFDSHVYYQNRHGTTNDDNHWLMDYNNLRKTLLT